MSVLKHQKLFIHDPLNAREFSEVYFSEETADGQLFIILELPKAKIDQQPIIDQIIRAAAGQFALADDRNAEVTLEKILQKLNRLLPDIMPVKINNWLSTLDLAVGIIWQQHVFLSTVGKIEGLLVHQNQLTAITEKSKNINLLKIFSDITSGELDDGDVLIISTESLFDYISQEKVRQLVKKYSPLMAVQQIEQLLETVPNFVNFNSIFIKKPGAFETAETLEPSELNAEEPDYPETIYPAGEPASDRPLSPAPRTRLQPKTKLVVDFDNLKKIKLVIVLRWLAYAGILYFRLVKKSVVKIWQVLKQSFLFIISAKYRRQHEDDWLAAIRQRISEKFDAFIKLSWQKKLLFIGLFMVVLIFLQSLVFLTQEKSEVKSARRYDEAILQINHTLNDVQASLIYNDEKRAEELLLEIQSMLAQLDPKSDEQRAEIAQAQEKTARILNQVRHINYVPEPVALFDFTDQLDEPRQIVQKNSIFYVLDKNNIYSLATDQVAVLAPFPDGTTLANWPDNNKLILGNNNGYSIFDLTTQSFATVAFNPSSGNTNIQDAVIFNNNLYILDSANSQIFRYNGSGQSFGGGQAWLKENLDLTDAYSLAIDGQIYLMKNDGQILKFNRGLKETFTYHQPQPALGTKVTIKTYPDSDYLYLLDPDNQRVIILNKDGNIKDQFTSPKFDDLQDLAINAEQTAIYLLNDSHLYLLPINQ